MFTFAMAVALAGSVEAFGPPIICDDLGFESPTFKPNATMAEAAVKALDTRVPALERLGILRNAALAAQERPEEGRELLARLMARALDAEAAGKAEANAWLDAGFIAATLRHLNVVDFAPGASEGAWGYAWLAKAETLAPSDPAFDFALALASQEGGRLGARHEAHVRAAIEGSEAGSVLRQSIELHLGRYDKGVGDYTREHASGR